MQGPNISRLFQAVRNDRQALSRYRKEYALASQQIAGNHYSDNGSDKRVPVNMLALFQDIVPRQLVPQNPRVMLTTWDQRMRPSVRTMQDWVNKEFERMGFKQTMAMAVEDASLSIGIVKIALATPSDAARYAWNLRAGSVFCIPVSLDDFVVDMRARDFREVDYIGHRFRANLDVIKSDQNYQNTDKLTASTNPQYNSDGDERTYMIGRGYTGMDEDFEEKIELYEIYCPRHRKVYTMTAESVDGGGGVLLREQDWIGPDTGPYEILGFGRVPGNLMPKAPTMDLMDMHMFINQTIRKLFNQANRQKEILASSGGDEDVERITKASDGDAVRMDAPDKAKVLEFGSPNAKNYQMFEAMCTKFSFLGKNLEILGGLSPQSKTLGQDKILAENASATIASMQAATIDFIENVIRKMCWYWWHDPFKVMQARLDIPGVPWVNIVRKVSPQERMLGDFEDLDIRVDPYSLQRSTPQSRLQAMRAIIREDFLPIAPLAAQQGVQLDLQTYFQKVGDYLDDPDFSELLMLGDPVIEQSGGPGPAGGGQETTHVRENIPMETNQGQANEAVSAMMAAEGAGGGRPSAA